MTKNQIQDLINGNDLIKQGYLSFKKQHRYNKILDMYCMVSFSGRYPSEVYIKYLENGKVKTFEYMEVM